MRHDLPDGTPSSAADVTMFVIAQLDAMPAVLRIGVSAVGVLVGLDAVVRGVGPGVVGRWETCSLFPVRQYVRLLRSLVVFAAYETAP